MSVKLRFAPSPTGYLHVGNIRTALVNWLFCQKQGGTFLLRFDDTDPERSKQEYADAIEEDLSWLGLQWDEVARQSERQSSYDAAAETLRAKGLLYPCYETPQELELKRKVQLSRGLPPVYDRAALELSEDERAALEADGRKPHWRFKLSGGAVIFEDGVRGTVKTEMSALSDPILIREDGSLLYTLPSVVDDIELGITHVFRGEDHVTNTAAQVEIYQALGGDVPQFAHFALLTGKGGEALSKRLGGLAIRDMRADGLEPSAVTSLLGRIGTSDPIEPFADLRPLVESFDLSKFGRSAARFDPDELAQLNAKIVHGLDFAAVQDRIAPAEADLWETARPNLDKVSDIADWLAVVEGPVMPKIEDADFIAQAAALLPAEPWDNETWGAWTQAVKAETGAKGRGLFMPLRQALTGRDHGPELAGLLPLIGAARARQRLAGETA